MASYRENGERSAQISQPAQRPGTVTVVSHPLRTKKWLITTSFCNVSLTFELHVTESTMGIKVALTRFGLPSRVEKYRF